MASLYFSITIQLTMAILMSSLDMTNALATGYVTTNATSALTRANEDQNKNPDIAVLDNIGQVALKLVEILAATEDEKVEISLISEFVQALSRAAVMIKNPQIPQLEDIKAEFAGLKEQLVEEKKKLNDQIEQKLEQCDAKNNLLEQRVNESATTIRHLLETDNERKVGFTATATTNQALSSGTIVQFEKVQVNEGGHYDPTAGTFTCPFTGLYLMSVTITAYTTNHIRVYLTMGGTNQFYLYSQGGNSHHFYNSVSQTGLVKCNAGSKIWAKANGDGTSWGGQYTSFSGFLYETTQ